MDFAMALSASLSEADWAVQDTVQGSWDRFEEAMEAVADLKFAGVRPNRKKPWISQHTLNLIAD
eukprot:4405409-Alexandrium_andersonii.AAC.1